MHEPHEMRLRGVCWKVPRVPGTSQRHKCRSSQSHSHCHDEKTDNSKGAQKLPGEGLLQ